MVTNKDKRLKAFFIFVDDGKIDSKLTELADKAKAQEVCLATLSPKSEAVGAYKVNLDPKVKNTVMLYRNRRVTTKLVNLESNEKGQTELKAAISELLK